MLRAGLVSVTFRQRDPAEVAALARSNGLEQIEWGGDVHVPPGDETNTKRVRALTLSAGLSVAAYGSYFRLGASQDFEPVLQTARWLGAPTIRIWAGSRASRATDRNQFEAIALELRTVASRAAAAGITVSLEFHPATLTDTTESAVRLLGAAVHPAIRSYWQIPPGWSEEEQQASLHALQPWLSHLHVFHWTGPSLERRPLVEAQSHWEQLLRYAATDGREHGALLEFVRDDSPAALVGDAACLRNILQMVPASGPAVRCIR
jgi:sugar phosphate isomerase/epimerase